MGYFYKGVIIIMPASEQYWKMFNFVLGSAGKVLEFHSCETVGTLIMAQRLEWSSCQAPHIRTAS